MKDNVTRSNINDHLIELNYGSRVKDDDTDNMEKDPPPQKKKSR